MNSRMNKFKEVTFKDYIDIYMDNLHETYPFVEDFVVLFKLKRFATFESIIKSMTNTKSQPLPLYFDNPKSPSLDKISSQEKLVTKIFEYLDLNKIGRIDAYEFITPFSLVVKGKFDDKYWNMIATNFGVEIDDCIMSDELFYFLDSLFRGLAKLLILKEDDPKEPTPRKFRLEYTDIGKLVEGLLGGPDIQYVNKKELKENAKKNCPELHEFLKYVHANGSAMGWNRAVWNKKKANIPQGMGLRSALSKKKD